MNYRLQNAEKTSGFTINTHQKCLKFDDKTPKNALKFMQKMRQIFSELSVWRLRPKFYLKKPCVSLFVVGVLRCGLEFHIKRNFVFFVAFLGIFTSALKADYTRTLPSSITLAGGKSETHKAMLIVVALGNAPLATSRRAVDMILLTRQAATAHQP